MGDLNQFLVQRGLSIREALRVLDSNAHGICFIVDEQDRLLGVATDGDVRRGLLKGASLDDRIDTLANRSCTSLSVSAGIEQQSSALSQRIRCIPLLDEQGRVVDYAATNHFVTIPVMDMALDGNESAYIADCLRQNWISSQGHYVRRFEADFAQYLGMSSAVAVSSGTAALHLALLSLGIGPGDEVIVPDFTFAATANAVIHSGAIPVLAEVCESDWTLDPEGLEALITDRTRAIVPVHIYGAMCDMEAISRIAARDNLLIIEDCAESLGSELNGLGSGRFGHAAAFSFFGNKTITTGEGGMVLFQNSDHEKMCRILRDHGMNPERRYWHEHIGFNYRMTNLQAAIGVAQLERIERILDQKRTVGKFYLDRFREIPELIGQIEIEDSRSSYWLNTFRIDEKAPFGRSELMAKLARNGIETRPGFHALHTMPPYKQFQRTDLSVSRKIGEQTISFPSSATLTNAECERVFDTLHDIVRNSRMIYGG